MQPTEAQTVHVKEIEACRACGSREIKLALELGEQYISDFPKKDEDGAVVPLNLMRCESCGLVQLSHSVDSDTLYSFFWYQSSISSTMRESLKDIVNSTLKRQAIRQADYVIDIGCNDGTLLSFFPGYLHRIGFEPAKNVADLAKKKGYWIFNEYFNAKTYLDNLGTNKAKIITAIAMFYDLDDPSGFVKDVASCLHSQGTFVVQQNYLGSMLQNGSFDNICHEHLEYYSLGAMEKLLSRFGLEVYHIELNNVNGGSFRTYIGFKEAHPVDTTVERTRKMEAELGLDTDKPFRQFETRIQEIRKQLVEFVLKEKKAGKTIFVLGASTRGNTLLQYCGLDWRIIDGAVDKNPDKWDRVTVGTKIPIMSRKDAGDPDYFLVLPYHFLEEFLEQEREYRKKGGKFIIPIPILQVM